ncbi:MAG: phytanoyl-CoA dioxygenase family protein [Ectothiorhodospiraceae bacterium]|nr:phytanoyl-CoA dioxygenase family protein [Ectothiorhodospiraceae bacterium]
MTESATPSDPSGFPTDAEVDAFQRDGVALVRGLFTDWIEPLRRGVATNMARPSWRERTYHPADGSAPFFQDLCNWSVIPDFRDFVERSPMAALAARLMRSNVARIFHDHILVKEPGNSIVTPWHQDQPYYFVRGEQTVSFWIPLDPISRDIAIEYVAGSHRWGKEFTPSRFDGSKLYDDARNEPVPDVEASRDRLSIVGWAMEPGDVVAFDFRTLHGAPANHSTQRRRVVSLRWVGDDAEFVERPGPTSPPFPDLRYRTGDPFEGPDFPVVHRRAG